VGLVGIAHGSLPIFIRCNGDLLSICLSGRGGGIAEPEDDVYVVDAFHGLAIYGGWGVAPFTNRINGCGE
jgi:hypothetical protein